MQGILRTGRATRWLALVLAGLTASAGAAVVAGDAAAAAPTVPHVPLNPGGAIQMLEQERAGFGSPQHAAQLATAADAQALALKSRPGVPGAAGASIVAGWGSLGPAQMTNSFYGVINTGRVDSIAVTPSGTIFEGAAGGGVWRSTDGGATWSEATSDNISSGLAIGALTVDPANPNVIYAATGEANNCGDCFYGGGILKSTDGGSSWSVINPNGMFTGVDSAQIAVDASNDQRVYVTTTSGLYVSTDGGLTWHHPTGTYTNGATWGLALDQSTSPATAYVITASVGIQKSTDGGTNFTTLSAGLPSAANVAGGQIGIGTATATNPTGDHTLYAAIQLQGMTDPNGGGVSMYKSTDGGNSWGRLTIPAYTNQSYAYGSGNGDQAWYDNAIAVDPANPSHVAAAGIAPVESTDGGSSWRNVNGGPYFSNPYANTTHPDFHAVQFTPAGHVLFGNDGGVYDYNPTTGPSASNPVNLNNGQVTGQFYANTPLGVNNDGALILGGLQDNGTQLYNSASGSPTHWPQVLTGDGGPSAINPLDTNEQFAEADQGLYVTTHAWSGAQSITPSDAPPGSGIPAPAGTNFTPPIAIVSNPASVDNPTVFYGGGDLYVTTNPTASPPSWTKVTSVGAGVSAIAPAPSNPAVLYVGFDNGTLLVSTNANTATPTFTQISTGASPAQWITSIDVKPTDPTQIAMSYSYSNTQGSPAPPMVQTASVSLAGTPSATYSNITGNLPTGVASDAVVDDGGRYMVATDVGVFQTLGPNGSSTNWSAVGAGLPNVQVVGLNTDGVGNLYAFTHGRGAWKYPFQAPPDLTGNGATNVTDTAATVHATIDPHGSDAPYKIEYGTTTSFGTVVGPFDAGSGQAPTAITQTLTGLSPATTYFYRVCANNAADPGTANQVCSVVQAFTTTGASTAPTATTQPATGVGAGGATLNGVLDAHGSQTAYTFEYGTPAQWSSGTTTLTGPPYGNGGNTTAGLPVSASVTGLQPNTTYWYRLIATNGVGTTTGALMAFTTSGTAMAPVVSTGQATNISQTGATLNGTVNPEGQQTAYTFEYGPGTSLGNITSFDNAGSYGGSENVSLPASGLNASTTYCFRIVATNHTGTSVGDLHCFTTSP